MPVSVYILASARDSQHREELEKLLSIHRGLLSYWSTVELRPGDSVAPEILSRIESSQIMLWLISTDFRHAEERGPEVRHALAMEKMGRLRIVPVLVRTTTHYDAPYAGRAVLPDNKVPVASWTDKDAAWRNVAAGIRQLAQEISGRSSAPSHNAPMIGYPEVSPGHWAEGREAPPSPRPGPVSASRVTVPPVGLPVAGAKSYPGVPPSGPSWVPDATAPYLPPQHSQFDLQMPTTAGAHTAPSHRRSWLVPFVLSSVAVIALVALWKLRDKAAETVSPESARLDGPEPRPAQADRPPTAEPRSTPASAQGIDTTVCCGGIDCSAPTRGAPGTSCDNGALCAKCSSGRTRVVGTCATPIPESNRYLVRIAGATFSDGTYMGKTDTVCVQKPGSPAACGVVSAAESSHLLGALSIGDLTDPRGIHVWFVRNGDVVRDLPAMRIDRTKRAYTMSALCVGATVYSANKDVVRFHLDDP